MSSNPIYSLFATPGNLAPFLLRMALTSIFVYHGGREAFGWFGGDGWHHTIELQTSPDGMNLPYLVAVAAIVAQLGACLSLFFGFLTRLGGLVVAAVATATLLSMTKGVGFDGIEFYMLVLVTGLALAFIGGGLFSVDRTISNNLLPQVG
ncbi:DoxX family protein [soil metagenome]